MSQKTTIFITSTFQFLVSVRRDSMGIFKDIGKVGLIVSFISAIAYELTGASSLKAFSIVVGVLSLVILSSYLTQVKGMSKARDILVFLRLLK